MDGLFSGCRRRTLSFAMTFDVMSLQGTLAYFDSHDAYEKLAHKKQFLWCPFLTSEFGFA